MDRGVGMDDVRTEPAACLHILRTNKRHTYALQNTHNSKPNSLGYIVHKCQAERGCYNRTYIESHLREQYPRLQVRLFSVLACGCDRFGSIMWVGGLVGLWI